MIITSIPFMIFVIERCLTVFEITRKLISNSICLYCSLSGDFEDLSSKIYKKKINKKLRYFFPPLQALKVLRTSEFMPYVVFIAAPDLETLRAMHKAVVDAGIMTKLLTVSNCSFHYSPAD